MSGARRFLVVIVLVALLVAAAYVLFRWLGTLGGILAPVPTATVVGPTPVQPAYAPDLLEVRLHYCRGSETYDLLSIPSDAAFSMALAAQSATGAASIPVTGQTPKPTATARVRTQAPDNLLGSVACAEVGTLDKRKLVLCRGRQASHLTLTVSNHAGSRAYSLSLPACANATPRSTP